MKKIFHPSLPVRKKKIKIALFIRITCVLALPLVYFVSSLFNGDAAILQHQHEGNIGGEFIFITKRYRILGGLVTLLIHSYKTYFPSLLKLFISNINGFNVSIFKAASNFQHRLLLSLQLNETTENPIQFTQPHNNSHTPNSFQNCTQPSIFEFPSDGFTRTQRRHGWVALHILMSCYCFWLLAIVCDDYFVPAMESMCQCEKCER